MDKPLMLITGGSQGIGAATALLAAKKGYNVCFSYHSPQKISRRRGQDYFVNSL